ncbi:MAG: hypothetical protein LBS33_06675 [Streptococcaceae bacterium]|jgi:gas vesicle protein|nr:hypothetical protein [Streptococcaceae bacterium]
MSKEKKSGLVSGLIIGGVIGGVATYLLAPKAGELKEKVEKTLDELDLSDDCQLSELLKRTGNDLKRSAADVVEHLKAQGVSLSDVINPNGQAFSAGLFEAFNAQTQEVSDELDEVEDIVLDADELVDKNK